MLVSRSNVRLLYLDPLLHLRFRMLDTALSSALYQIVKTFQDKHKPNAPLLPRHGLLRRRMGHIGEAPRLTGKIIEFQELPASFNATTDPVDEEVGTRALHCIPCPALYPCAPLHSQYSLVNVLGLCIAECGCIAIM